MKKILKLINYMGISCLIYMIMGIFFTTGEAKTNIICFLILVGVITVSSLIYEIESLPMLAKTIAHLLISIGTFFIISAYGKWFPLKLEIAITALLVFLVIFFIFWSVFYMIEKKKIDEINRTL